MMKKLFTAICVCGLAVNCHAQWNPTPSGNVWLTAGDWDTYRTNIFPLVKQIWGATSERLRATDNPSTDYDAGSNISFSVSYVASYTSNNITITNISGSVTNVIITPNWTPNIATLTTNYSMLDVEINPNFPAITSTNYDGSTISIVASIPLDGRLLLWPYATLFSYRVSRAPYEQFVDTNQMSGGNFNTYLATHSEFPKAISSPTNLFISALGPMYAGPTPTFWRFARDSKPCGALLATGNGTTNRDHFYSMGYISYNYEDYPATNVPSSAQPYVMALPQIQSTSSNSVNYDLAGWTVELYGPDAENGTVSSTNAQALNKHWTWVTNMTITSSDSNACLTVFYPTNSLMYFSQFPVESGQLMDLHGELNMLMLNQRYAVLRQPPYINAPAQWYRTNGFDYAYLAGNQIGLATFNYTVDWYWDNPNGNPYTLQNTTTVNHQYPVTNSIGATTNGYPFGPSRAAPLALIHLTDGWKYQ